MTQATGKALRLSRVISPKDDRSFSLAFDHGMMLGPIRGMDDPGGLLAAAVAAEVDAIILTPGLVARYGPLLHGRGGPAIILRVDQTTMWRVDAAHGYAEGYTRQVVPVEDAAAMGADAVITYFFTGHRNPELESRSLEICGAVAHDCRRLGLVHVMEPMAARGGLAANVFDPAIVAMNCRMAAELGADIVKTDWTGDAASFRQVVETAEAPVVAAGGARDGGDRDTLATVAGVLESGAAGILFGRNLFQSADPPALMRAAKAMIHDGRPLKDALKLLG